MRLDEVVDHEADCQRILQVHNLSRESVGKPSEPSILGPKLKIQPFYITCADVLFIGLPADNILACSAAFAGAVLALWCFTFRLLKQFNKPYILQSQLC